MIIVLHVAAAVKVHCDRRYSAGGDVGWIVVVCWRSSIRHVNTSLLYVDTLDAHNLSASKTIASAKNTNVLGQLDAAPRQVLALVCMILISVSCHKQCDLQCSEQHSVSSHANIAP